MKFKIVAVIVAVLALAGCHSSFTGGCHTFICF